MKFDLLIQKLKEGIEHINLQKRLENHQYQFTTFPPFWRLYNSKLASQNVTFNSLKFSSDSDPNVPPNTPGVYLFVLKPTPVIIQEYAFVMYVGMTDQGLIERLNSGYRTQSGIKKRPHVHRLILDFGNWLEWYYAPLVGKTDDEIKEIESNLIGYFCDPPINRKDAPELISNATRSKMF
mgnify:CR=1 FL=1